MVFTFVYRYPLNKITELNMFKMGDWIKDGGLRDETDTSS